MKKLHFNSNQSRIIEIIRVTKELYRVIIVTQEGVKWYDFGTATEAKSFFNKTLEVI